MIQLTSHYFSGLIILRSVFNDRKKVNLGIEFEKWSGKMSQDVKRNENMNYETLVDSFMPHKPKIIVDRPIHPERRMEEQELLEEYERIYEEYEM